MSRRKSKSRSRKGSGTIWALAAILLVVLLAAGGAVAWLLMTPYGPATETFVDVAPGSTVAGIGRQLEAAGVVRSRFAFQLLRMGRRGGLRAGEYRFDHLAPATEVFDRLVRGDVFTRVLAVPEGANIFEIAGRVEQAGFGTKEEFLSVVVNQTSLVADLDPGAKSLEGYLFPDTYRFSPKATVGQIVAAMVRRFRVVAGQAGLKENVHELVTIASLVERETAVAAERPLVASVLKNRLARKMPLMTDPALIYGLELDGRWRGVIHQSELARNFAWNTYSHPGLPPGPIANPGLKSLRAAMEPARTNYLYFVAAGTDSQGHSLFSATLEEHNRNVAEYRRALKKAGAR